MQDLSREALLGVSQSRLPLFLPPSLHSLISSQSRGNSNTQALKNDLSLLGGLKRMPGAKTCLSPAHLREHQLMTSKNILGFL